MFQKKIVTALLLFSFVSVLSAQSVGGITTGATLYCDSLNSGFISLTSYNGQVLYWEASLDNEQSWINIPNTTSTQSYNKLTQTTSFRAIVKDGQFPSDTSSVSTITVYVPGNAGNLSGGGHYCDNSGNGILTITGAPGSIVYWQYCLTNGSNWNTINSTSSSLSYTAITKNTLYRAIVHTVPGCPDDTTSSVSFIIQPKTIAGSILKNDSLCYGAPGDTLYLSGSAGKILNWFRSEDNGNNWTILPDSSSFITYSTVTNTSWYKAVLKNGICPAETTTPAVIALYNSNPAYAGEDATITRHEKINLHGSGNGNASWNNPEYLSDPFSFNPAADPLNTTHYILTLTDTHGCITRDSVTVNVIVPIPTAITPNGDGVNDFFEIDKIEHYANNSLLIFNRWGNLVFKAKPYNNTWDGRSLNGHDLPDDQYYFVFDFGDGGKTITNYILIKR